MSKDSVLTCASCGVVYDRHASNAGDVCPECASQHDTSVSRQTEEPTLASDPNVSLGSSSSQRSKGGCSQHTDVTPAEFQTPRLDTPERSDATLSVDSESVARVWSSESSDKPRAIPSHIGRFDISEELGVGGFGTVYRAHDSLLDREVALKVPVLDGKKKSYELFLHEAKAAARLRHPNIVTVFECGVADEKPYIASQFIDGTTLSKRLPRERIEIRHAVELVQQVAEAIQYAHSEGIVHRDLKPGNIILDKSGRPQVMDFGLARLGTDPETSLMNEGAIVGTPAYMAPEQARGDRDAVGPKSDQYSVGVLLYVLLCGKRPYKGDAWSIISRVANPVVQPVRPCAIRDSIPPDLEACCLKAMEKDPGKRYDDLSEMADDLTNWLEGRPLVARPIGAFERLRRWCDRNRMIASLLGVITVLILTGSCLAFVLAAYATGRAREATKALQEVERVLIDTYAESGLDAGSDGRSQEAILWFGSAAQRAARSGEHPHRERVNRSRFQTWLNETPIPVRMFPALAHWHRSLVVHASGRFVLSEQDGGDQSLQCQIWNVPEGNLWPSPWDADISAAAWNPKGDVLVLASGNAVRAYSFPAGKEIRRWNHGDDKVLNMKFSDDGSRIAVGGESTTQIRQMNGGQSDIEQWSSVLPTGDRVTRLAWSPSGKRLATLTANEQVQVWLATDASDPAEVSSGGESLITPLRCPIASNSPMISFLDDNRLLVPESEQAVRCWDVKQQQPIWEVPGRVGVDFNLSLDRKRVAIMDRSTLWVVNADTGEPILDEIVHPNIVYCAAFDPSGDRILTGCSDQMARVYSTTNGQLINSIRHSDMVHRLAWFPDGQACVTAHWKAELVRVWRLGMASESGYESELPGGVMHVEWNEDGSYFLPSGTDLVRGVGPYRVLSTADGRPVGVASEFPGRVSDGCFLPQRRAIALAGAATAGATGEGSSRIGKQDLYQPGLIVASNIDTGEPVFPPIETKANVAAIEASPDGSRLVALCCDHQLLVIDPRTGEVLHRHEAFPGVRFFQTFVIYRRIAFAPAGDRFVIWGSQSRVAEMRSTEDGSLLFEIRHAKSYNTDWLHDVVFSPDGKTLATCSADQTAQLWDSETGASRGKPLRHTGWVFSAVFSRDGKRLLTSCMDKQARLWDLDSPEEPLVVTPAQPDEVYAVGFLADESVFLTGLRNGEVSAWDTRQGRMIAPTIINATQGATYTISLSPDQSRVVIIGKNARVRGYPPSRWQPEIDYTLTGDDLQMLGEMISGQRLQNGVMIGLTNEMLLKRWDHLRRKHASHPVFQWPELADGAIEVDDAMTNLRPQQSTLTVTERK